MNFGILWILYWDIKEIKINERCFMTEEQVENIEQQSATIEPFKIHYSKTGLVQDCKCLLCNPSTFHSEGSVAAHLKSTHGQGRKYGIGYVKVDENGNELASHTHKLKDLSQKKTNPKIQLDVKSSALTMNELQMPLTITIPIIIGKIRIQ
jgi:hypothetical protein